MSNVAKFKKHQCPREFCFHWVTKGGAVGSGATLSWNSIEDAFENATWTEFFEAGCGSGTKCIRSQEPGVTTDSYEPNEPELDRAGLSHHQFCDPRNCVECSVQLEIEN